jgi:hypothetical protein
MRAPFQPVQKSVPVCQRLSRRCRRLASLLFVAAPGLTLLLLWQPAAAQNTPPANPAGKAAVEAEKPPEPAGPPAAIAGFRAAQFGMTEEQLRHAVAKDFPNAAAKLKKGMHPSEKTTVLTLPVPDLLPHTGTAQVSYILGYKSKKLIQVNVIWRSDGGEESNEAVVGTANALRDYFAGQSYKPGSVAANRQLGDNAIVVFRGADAQDRLILIVLNGQTAAAAKDEKAPHSRPLSLELSYIADAAHPDVFRIPKGQF